MTLKSLRPKSKGTFFDLKEVYVDFIDACTSFKKRQNIHLKLAFSSFSLMLFIAESHFFLFRVTRAKHHMTGDSWGLFLIIIDF